MAPNCTDDVHYMAAQALHARMVESSSSVEFDLTMQVFEWQAWVAMLVGGLLSFNVLFPTDEPSIPRLMG